MKTEDLLDFVYSSQKRVRLHRNGFSFSDNLMLALEGVLINVISIDCVLSQ